MAAQSIHLTNAERRELSPMLAAPRAVCLSRAAARWAADAGADRLTLRELSAELGSGCGRRWATV